MQSGKTISPWGVHPEKAGVVFAVWGCMHARDLYKPKQLQCVRYSFPSCLDPACAHGGSGSDHNLFLHKTAPFLSAEPGLYPLDNKMLMGLFSPKRHGPIYYFLSMV